MNKLSFAPPKLPFAGSSAPLRMLAIALMTATLLLAVGPAGAQQCYTPQQTQQAISNNQIVPLAIAMKRAGLSAKTTVLKVTACGGGSPYYQVTILNQSGATQTLNLPAGR